jgi:hypothetical protein
MKYRRITESLNDKGTLIASDQDVFSMVKNIDKDYYLSTFKYDEDHKRIFLETGTIAGITDLTTDKIWFDFDSDIEPALAKKDAVILVQRLIEKGIDRKDIIITFSGNKGFGIEFDIEQELSPKEIKDIAFKLASDLPTFDTKVYNASRILRIINTKHPKTKMFKRPLTFNTLCNSDMHMIMEIASKPFEDDTEEFRWGIVNLPESIYKKTNNKPIVIETEDFFPEITTYLDYSSKPKFLTNCRWAIQNGHFKAGERSTALLCLASTYKNLGFDLEHVYRLLKGTAELQSRVNNQTRFSDEEIYNNIIVQVFSPNWKNGQYTCREKNNWLQTFCEELDHPCNHKEDDQDMPKGFLDIKDSFKDYVTKIEQNTVTTGIPSIDKNVFISTGANVGIIGAPGSGKSSIALNILNNTSKAGVHSVFASLDMHKNRMFEKVLYKISGKNREDLYDMFKQNKEGPLMQKLKEEFGNVFFFNKSSPTVSDVRDYIIACQEQSGVKIKLVMLDYFERISSDLGDDTAASKRVAGELQDMVNDLDVALINLVQPHKQALAGGPDSPIYDYTKIKGSSYVYQSMRIIMSLWRPFYNPKNFENDKYMKMAVLKNDLGELAEFAFKWDGPTGTISEMEQFDEQEFRELLEAKEKSNENKNGGLNF